MIMPIRLKAILSPIHLLKIIPKPKIIREIPDKNGANISEIILETSERNPIISKSIPIIIILLSLFDISGSGIFRMALTIFNFEIL